MRVLGFGTYDTTKHPRVGIILDGLRAHGDEVVEANAPLGFSTADRVTMLNRPWTAYRLLLRMAARWAQIVRSGRHARRTGRFDAIIVGYLGHFDVVLARIAFPRDTIVVDLLVFGADTARDRGVHGGFKLYTLTLFDRLAARCADVILLDTDEHVGLLRPKQRSKAVVVPVGAADEWFAAASLPRTDDDTHLRVVFFGLFTPLQGTDVISDALSRLADAPAIQTTMIGSGQGSAHARELAADNPNVNWLDWVDPAKLPGIVAAHDVCLGVFGTGPKAQRVVPNKVYQGAAAGCAIVTSDTPPQRRAFGDDALLLPADDAVGLAAALTDLASDNARLAQLRRAARSRAVSQFTASAIVGPLRTRLTSAPDIDPDEGEGT